MISKKNRGVERVQIIDVNFPGPSSKISDVNLNNSGPWKFHVVCIAIGIVAVELLEALVVAHDPL
jgi:hypothetical protein